MNIFLQPETANNYDSYYQTDEFIKQLNQPELTVETGKMSTLITGDYEIVMKALTDSMKNLMDDNASVFNLKISNACLIQ